MDIWVLWKVYKDDWSLSVLIINSTLVISSYSFIATSYRYQGKNDSLKTLFQYNKIQFRKKVKFLL